jgi:hypothetical protein
MRELATLIILGRIHHSRQPVVKAFLTSPHEPDLSLTGEGLEEMSETTF